MTDINFKAAIKEAKFRAGLIIENALESERAALEKCYGEEGMLKIQKEIYKIIARLFRDATEAERSNDL